MTRSGGCPASPSRRDVRREEVENSVSTSVDREAGRYRRGASGRAVSTTFAKREPDREARSSSHFSKVDERLDAHAPDGLDVAGDVLLGTSWRR